MAAVILFLVPVFHGLVFSGLALWFRKSQKPKLGLAAKLAATFSGAGVLANVILSIMLIELLNGLSLITSGGKMDAEISIGTLIPIILATQILFVALLFPTTQAIFKKAY